MLKTRRNPQLLERIGPAASEGSRPAQMPRENESPNQALPMIGELCIDQLAVFEGSKFRTAPASSTRKQHWRNHCSQAGLRYTHCGVLLEC